MRAAVLHHAGGTPETGDFREPGGDTVTVLAAAGNPVDVLLASGSRSRPPVPSVVGQDGVGITDSGARVYFNAPPAPFGSWAERCPIDPDQVFPVPDGVDDALAAALGTAGVAAWLALTHHAHLSPGQSVLVLGATGAVGRIAVQAARLLGAGSVVAAGRDRTALRRCATLGADATVALGSGDNTGPLRAAAGDGFDVVVDAVYGAPFRAALAATAVGSTVITVGFAAGDEVVVPYWTLQGRTHTCHANPLTPLDTRRDAYAALMLHAAAGRITVETQSHRLEQAAQAWQSLERHSRAKVVVTP